MEYLAILSHIHVISMVRAACRAREYYHSWQIFRGHCHGVLSVSNPRSIIQVVSADTASTRTFTAFYTPCVARDRVY